MKYWIIIDGVQKGPYSLDEVTSTPGLNPSTPVWHEGLSDWTTAAAIPEIVAHFSQPNPWNDPTANRDYGQQSQADRRAFYGQNPYGNAPYGNAPYGYNQGNGNGTPPPMPDNYLIWSILATICCCLPTGIIAIIYASKVSPAYYRGDYMAAMDASSKAQMWLIISFVAGLICAPFSVLLSSFY
ncbi:MAG: CD225/dispanin family protein [Bacteroides sp.]|nr:CD225/dispanin family protein [Bacteroides sp.]